MSQHSYQTVKIAKGHLIDRIKGSTQQDWITVCQRLNVVVSTAYGNGSHAAAYKDNCDPSDKSCCILTITKNQFPQIQRAQFKKLLAYGLNSGKFTEEDIWKAFGVL